MLYNLIPASVFQKPVFKANLEMSLGNTVPTNASKHMNVHFFHVGRSIAD
jgi:hypothetical protein